MKYYTNNSSVVSILEKVIKNQALPFISVSNTRLLANHRGRDYLVKMLNSCKENMFNESYILAHTDISTVGDCPQISVLPDDKYSIEYAKALNKFESYTRGGDRWKFNNQSVNNFFIKLFNQAANAFGHDLDVNDLFHGHLTYVSTKNFDDLAIVFHAKEAPNDEILRQLDGHVKRSSNLGNHPFDYKSTKNRNIIYLVKHNKLFCYDNRYFNDKNKEYFDFDIAVTGGIVSAWEKLSTALDGAYHPEFKQYVEIMYAARTLNEESLGKKMGDVNFFLPEGLKKIEMHHFKKELAKFKEEPLLYFVTGRSHEEIYQRKMLDIIRDNSLNSSILKSSDSLWSAPVRSKKEDKPDSFLNRVPIDFKL